MFFLERGIATGLAILSLDFLAWRFLRSVDRRVHFFIRVVLFLVLSYVLWTSGMVPFHAAPWSDEPAKHLLAQILELLWWLQAAQVSTEIAGGVFLPPHLHRARLFQDVLRALVFLGAFVAAIGYVLDLPIKGLLATSGVLAIIIGLAVQSTLSDVFSGVVLNATQPFRLGDTVAIGDIQGEVIESNWRATTLLNGQGNFVVVPNSLAAKASIINQSLPPRMHGLEVSLRISPAFRPAMVISSLNDAVISTAGVLDSPSAVVSATAVRRKHVEYTILVYVASSAEKSKTRNEIIDQAYRHLKIHGIGLSLVGREAAHLSPKERLLRDIEMFHTLNDEQFSQLAGALVSQHFLAGQLIYQVDVHCPDEQRALYIVASGVAALKSPRGDHNIELRRLSPGDSIGRAGILTGVSSPITLRAVTRVSIFLLHKEALTPILQQNPEVAKSMLESLMAYEAKAAELLNEVPVNTATRGDLFHRLLSGMRRLHGISH